MRLSFDQTATLLKVTKDKRVEMEGASQEVSWYAVRVRSNFERITSISLKHKGYEEFAPFCKSKQKRSGRTNEVECPLFPGYVFCRFDPRARLPVLQTPGVVSVVSFGNGPTPVDEQEIANLKTLVQNGRDAVPWPYLRVGQKVRVVGGPLHGVEGMLVDLKNNHRIVISVSLLQRSVSAQIEPEFISPVL